MTQGQRQLDVLWRDVVRARAAVAEERELPQRQSGPTSRTALVHALEAYLGQIAQRGYPAPYLLTCELQTQRLMCSRVGVWRDPAG